MNLIIIVPYYAYASELSSSFIHNQIKAIINNENCNKVLVLMMVPLRKGTVKHYLKRNEEIDGVVIDWVFYFSFSRIGESIGLNLKSAYKALNNYIRKRYREYTPDAIYVHTLREETMGGALYGKANSIPVITTIHGSDITVPYEKLKTERIRKLINLCDSIITVSEKLKNIVKEIDKLKSVTVIINGYKTVEEVDPSRKKPLSFVHVSNLIPQKNADKTIRMFSELKKRYSDANLTIIGEGPEIDKLVELVSMEKLEEDVLFCGRLPNDQTQIIMKKTDYFVLPSVKEGFGIVYLEAMANGCITIGTKGEGIDGFILDRDTGFLIDVNDERSLSDVVEYCETNKEKKELIRRKGREKAASQTWENNSLNVIKTIKETIDQLQ